VSRDLIGGAVIETGGIPNGPEAVARPEKSDFVAAVAVRVAGNRDITAAVPFAGTALNMRTAADKSPEIEMGRDRLNALQCMNFLLGTVARSQRGQAGPNFSGESKVLPS